MEADVNQWTSACVVCQSRKEPQQHQQAPRQNNRISMSQWEEVVQVEIQAPLPVPERENRHVLYLTDAFSKWVEAAPISRIVSQTVARTMRSVIVLRHATSEIIHSNQGRQLDSDLLNELCNLLGMKKIRLWSVLLRNRKALRYVVRYCTAFHLDIPWMYAFQLCGTYRARAVKNLLQHMKSGLELIRQRFWRAQQMHNRHFNRRVRYCSIRVVQLVILNAKVLQPKPFQALRRK